MVINISDAKTQLSGLVDMAYHGEKVVIAKNNTPLVDLVPHKPEGKRQQIESRTNTIYASAISKRG